MPMIHKKLREALLELVPADGTTIGNGRLRQAIGEKLGREVDEADYAVVRDALVEEGVLAKGLGRGGSVRLAAEGAKKQPAPEPNAAKPAAARGSTSSDEAQVLSYRHGDRRKNNPEVGMVDPDTDPAQPKTRWAYDPHVDPALQFDIGRAQVERLIDDALASGDQDVMRRALEQLKRQAMPYLNWTGKAERTSFEVDTVSLHVHERIDPASILNAVRKRLKGEKAAQPKTQLGLFSAPFENLPLRDAIDFYKHDKGWSNRLIAGDSLLVMNSLVQKEGMAGQVQMIFIDPPYGIRYGSNFQPFVGKRDVRDRRDEDLTQEPEMLKAFRDTWEFEVHSYLSYLRDRLLLSKDLLHETGSVFVQISDENVHLVRTVLDEVFGSRNFISEVVFLKTTGKGSQQLDTANDYLLWYARNAGIAKYRSTYETRSVVDDENLRSVRLASGASRKLTDEEVRGDRALPVDARVFRPNPITNQRPPQGNDLREFPHRGAVFAPGQGTFRSDELGLNRCERAGRLMGLGKTLTFVRYLDDFAFKPRNNIWQDTRQSGFGDAKLYVVQTGDRVIERCLLMTTDPGDLVLDPTCGSGTTAFVAEKWGRRWITCDTSRVAVTLAKQRLMTASFDYYELKYPLEGLKGGFIYKTVPHVTLKSIANNPEIDEIYERMHPAIEVALAQLNGTSHSSRAPAGAFSPEGSSTVLLEAALKSINLPLRPPSATTNGEGGAARIALFRSSSARVTAGCSRA